MQKTTLDDKAKVTPTLGEDIDNCLIFKSIENQTGLEELSTPDKSPKFWFVLRDLKRSNTHSPAYKLFQHLGITYYTPMHWRLITRGSQKVREYVPFIQDLLFVYESRENLDTIVAKTPTLQYRFLKGKPFGEPMIVSEVEMNRFMYAVESTESPRYYLPSEITSAMCKRRIRIIGGNMDGYEGLLLSVRGSRIKRILVELPTWLVAAVEVNPEYIQLI